MASTSPEDVDVAFVGLGSTAGLRAAEEELVRSLRRAGACVRPAWAARPAAVRTLALTDLVWARAARRAAQGLLAGEPRSRTVLYSTVTAALLWPRPGAILFDAPAAANRPGRHGVWQRPLERRRLRQASLLLPASAGALAEARAALGGTLDAARVLVLPVPIAPAEPGGLGGPLPPDAEADERAAPPPPDPEADERAAPLSSRTVETAGCPVSPARDLAAITYAANPRKKGLDRVLEAWRRVRRPGERLVVAGVDRERLRAQGYPVDGDGVDVAGMLPAEEYRGLVRRARVYVCAPRREEYGLAQLEALAAGCQLVTTPAPGGYVALPLARALDPRLVGGDLGVGLRAALDAPAAGYAARAAELVAPFTAAAVDRLVAEELLPRLLGG